ncbi:MAG TPA: 5-formyltetrahydrofolate cyclo-ligase, partial [Geobacteraceae bacterium]
GSMPKRTLRQQLLARRKELGLAERKAAAHVIQQTFVGSREFAAARIIALYAAIHNEVETGEVFEAALAQGKTVLFPLVCGDNLDFRRVSAHEELRRGAYGIPEPEEGTLSCRPEEADLLVVPAVAFSVHGQRIGYGKGYYDRALHALEGSGKLVGFCYDFQLVDEIVGEPHDVRMDMIITEQRVVCPGTEPTT